MKRILWLRTRPSGHLPKDHLSELGYDVWSRRPRASGPQQIPEARPDLVLMDVNLGSGMSGGWTSTSASKELIDVPVIFVTAYSDADLGGRAGRSGSFGHLTKPFDRRFWPPT